MHSSDSEFIVREDKAIYETDTPVLYSVAEGIATLTLNRPTFNNAQNSQMTYALDACFRQAVNDDSVKVIVLRGNGKHFSAGHDIGTPGAISTSRLSARTCGGITPTSLVASSCMPASRRCTWACADAGVNCPSRPSRWSMARVSRVG